MLGSRIIVKLIIIYALLCSCSKEGEFSNIPRIEFKSGKIYKEKDKLGNINFVYKADINFWDGDGNMGLNKGDTTGDFDKTKKFYHNIFVSHYEKENGNYIKKKNISYNGRIPTLRALKPKKSLKGVIEYKIKILSYKSDTLKFDFQIADRALNLSNTIESPEVILKDK